MATIKDAIHNQSNVYELIYRQVADGMNKKIEKETEY